MKMIILITIKEVNLIMFNNINKIETDSFILKIKSKERILFNIYSEKTKLKTLINNIPPGINDCYKILSIKGGFSSIGIISYIAEKEKIEDLYVSTFRIGKKQFEELQRLKRMKLLDNVHLITSESQKKIDSTQMYKGKIYNYFDYIQKVCEEFNWNVCCYENHSKLILMKTKNNNFYVIETSSNLNENPKIEHYSWENDEELFNWYKKFFELMIVGDNNGN